MIVQTVKVSSETSRASSPVGQRKGIEELSIGRLDSIGIGEGALEVLKARTRAASESKVLEEAALRQLPDQEITTPLKVEEVRIDEHSKGLQLRQCQGGWA